MVETAAQGERKAVFIDRDGVLNRAIVRDGKPYPPQTLGEFVILPGVPEALRDLHRLGYLAIVVTNQPDVARGTQSREMVEAMNRLLREAGPIDDVLVCYHMDLEACDCRKPKPGMLLTAIRNWNIDPKKSVMVGDRWRDIEAGKAAGCRTILIDYGYDERRSEADRVVDSFNSAVHYILSQNWGF